MNITKLMASAMKVMPKTLNKKQLIGAALFGAGMLAGSLINCGGEEKKVGDSFEKKAEQEQKTDTIQAKPQEEKADTVAIPTVENFDEYQVGKGFIQSADTAYYPDSGKIGAIQYYSDKDKKDLKYQADFDTDGKLVSTTSFGEPDKDGKYRKWQQYDAKGDVIADSFIDEENGWQNIHYPANSDKEFKTTALWFDKEGNERIRIMNGGKMYPEYPELNSLEEIKIFFEKDGTFRRESHQRGDDEIEYYDKNNRLLKRKILGDNDVLKYTVVPKYDKEGTLIKNDTIKNEQ